MKTIPISRIVLGHNAFFGVDHLSARRGADRASQFSNPERILEVIKFAQQNGAGGMMMSTHERAGPVASLIVEDKTLANDLKIYPLLPYAQKYVTRSNEVGMVNVVLEMLSGTSLRQKMDLFVSGSKAVVSQDMNSVLSSLIQIELKAFKGLNVPAVFLHDAFTDLALAYDMPHIFEFYLEEIEKKFQARGAFTTKNLPTFLRKFREWKLPTPLVMTHFNKSGYHMNPDRSSCETAAHNYDVSILAMGSLASGFLRPDEAYEYLGGVPNIDGVVVGATSPAHIEETFQTIGRYMPENSKSNSPGSADAQSNNSRNI